VGQCRVKPDRVKQLSVTQTESRVRVDALGESALSPLLTSSHSGHSATQATRPLRPLGHSGHSALSDRVDLTPPHSHESPCDPRTKRPLVATRPNMCDNSTNLRAVRNKALATRLLSRSTHTLQRPETKMSTSPCDGSPVRRLACTTVRGRTYHRSPLDMLDLARRPCIGRSLVLGDGLQCISQGICIDAHASMCFEVRRAASCELRPRSACDLVARATS
jgi:hypothetical protein